MKPLIPSLIFSIIFVAAVLVVSALFPTNFLKVNVAGLTEQESALSSMGTASLISTILNPYIIAIIIIVGLALIILRLFDRNNPKEKNG